MHFHSTTLQTLLRKWPGRRLFGLYRFLPIFFFIGAGLELFMIKAYVGEVNFYENYKKKRVQELVEERLQQKKLM